MIDELAVVSLLLAAVALISCLSVADKRAVRRMPRAVWVTAIVLIPVGGPIGWFLFGRPHRVGPTRGWRVAVGLPEPPRPKAPDDDPDFLQSLDRPTEEDPEPEADDPGQVR